MLQPGPSRKTMIVAVSDPACARGRAAVGRRRRQRPAERPLALAAMGMTGQLQRDPRRYANGHIGFMRQKNERRVVGHLLQRRGEIVDADAPHRAQARRRQIGQLIAETGQPERATGLAQGARASFSYAGNTRS